MPRRDPRKEQSAVVRPADEPEDAGLLEDLTWAIHAALDQVEQINAQGVHEPKDPAHYVAKMLLERSSFRIGRKSTAVGGESATFTVKNPRVVYVSAVLPVPRGTTVRDVPLRATANVSAVVRDILATALRKAGVVADPVKLSVSEEPWIEPCEEPVVGAVDEIEVAPLRGLPAPEDIEEAEIVE